MITLEPPTNATKRGRHQSSQRKRVTLEKLRTQLHRGRNTERRAASGRDIDSSEGLQALLIEAGSINKAAQLARVSFATFARRMKEYGVTWHTQIVKEKVGSARQRARERWLTGQVA